MIDYKEAISKHSHADKQHNHKRFAIVDNFLEHSNKTSCWLEKTHPVEQFEPKHKNYINNYFADKLLFIEYVADNYQKNT